MCCMLDCSGEPCVGESLRCQVAVQPVGLLADLFLSWFPFYVSLKTLLVLVCLTWRLKVCEIETRLTADIGVSAADVCDTFHPAIRG